MSIKRRDFTSTFPKRLHRAMMTKGLNQTDLARSLDVSTTAVWNWLQGNTLPRPPMLTKLAAVLDCEEEDLRHGPPRESAQNAEEFSKSDAAKSVSEIMVLARQTIADVTGFDIERVKLSLELVSE